MTTPAGALLVRWDQVRPGQQALYAGNLYLIQRIDDPYPGLRRVWLDGWTGPRGVRSVAWTAVRNPPPAGPLAAAEAAELAYLRVRARLLQQRCAQLAVWLFGPAAAPRTCRTCGCTDTRACEGGCWWVSSGLCSTCRARGLG